MSKTPLSFSLDLLRSYVAVVETASFTKAADIVLRSQPTISDHIRRLELLFGVVLLSRTSRDVKMTPQGGVFLGYAKRLLSLGDEMAQALSANESREELLVSIQDSVLSVRVNQLLYALRKGLPNLEVRFTNEANPELLYNTTISFATELHPNSEVLATDQLVWVVSNCAFLRKEGALSVIVPADHDPLTDIMEQTLKRCERPWKIVHRSAYGCLHALRAGAGVMAFPRTMVGSELQVVERDIGLPDLPSILTLSRSDGGRATRELLEVMKRSYASAVQLTV